MPRRSRAQVGGANAPALNFGCEPSPHLFLRRRRLIRPTIHTAWPNRRAARAPGSASSSARASGGTRLSRDAQLLVWTDCHWTLRGWTAIIPRQNTMRNHPRSFSCPSNEDLRRHLHPVSRLLRLASRRMERWEELADFSRLMNVGNII